MRPKVTVIVPFYNSKDYICECIESLLNQTLTELEIICIDDGSTDGSFDIVQDYKQNDDRILLVSKSNKGYGHSMNLGFSLAKGEYIGILESDDYVVGSMFERLYTVAKGNDLDLVKSDFSRFYREGDKETNEVNEICQKNPSWYNCLLNPSTDPDLLDVSMNTWTGVYKSEFIEKYNIRHNETPGASFQDNGFWFQTFCLATRAMFLNETFYHVRRDNPNSSVNNREKVYCMAEEYKFILDFLKADEGRYERFIYMYHRRKYHNYIFTLDRIDDRFRMEFLRFMQKEYSQASSDQELKVNYFSEREWRDLTQLMESPNKYYSSRYGRQSFKNKIQGYVSMAIEKLSSKKKTTLNYKGIEDLFNSTNHEDNKKAFDLCEKTTDGKGESSLWMGRMYRDGKGVEKDLDKAIEWMVKAKDTGLNWAEFELMDMLILRGSKEDDREAFKIASSLAGKGNGGAMGRLSRMYRDGKGVEKNLDRAIEWMTKADYAGLDWAEFELMDMLILRGSKEDDREAFKIASSLAVKGNGGATGRIGRMYRDGRGVKKDLNLAAEWMARARDAGLNWANYELMDILILRGSKEDDQEAFKIASSLAGKGNGGAMGRIGRMYRDGRGVKKDLNLAAEWMRKAADKKVGWAEKELSDILQRIKSP